MFWNDKIQIPHQVYENSRLIIYLSRISGYFPISVRKVGGKLYLHWSPYYAIYSFALGTSLFTFTTWELYVVYLDNEQQVMTPTDKIALVFGHGGWMIIFAIGIFVIGNRFNQFIAFVKHLHEIDSTIKTNHAKSEKYLAALKMVVAPIFAMMYAVNTFHTYMMRGMGFGECVVNELGYYSLLTLATIVFYNVRHMIYNLEKRLDRLNELLEDKNCNLRLKSQKRIRKHFGPLPKPLRRTRKVLTDDLSDDDVLLLARVYMQLCDAAEILNAMFSSVMAIGIAIALVQVAQPTYFFIMAVRINNWSPLSVLGSSLIALFRNFTCALLIIESAYEFTLKVKVTEKLVCQLFCWNISAKRRRQVKIFAMCLGLRKIEFSAWSLFTVDRFLFADMIGTVITLMFLLLQMQEREHH